MDEIIVTGSNSHLIHDFIHAFGASFPIKHLGSLNCFLGIEVLRNSSDLFLCQSKYINDLLQRTNMSQGYSNASFH